MVPGRQRACLATLAGTVTPSSGPTPDDHADLLCTLPPEELLSPGCGSGSPRSGRFRTPSRRRRPSLPVMRASPDGGTALALVGDAAHGIHPLSGHRDWVSRTPLNLPAASRAPRLGTTLADRCTVINGPQGEPCCCCKRQTDGFVPPFRNPRHLIPDARRPWDLTEIPFQ